MGDGVGGRPSDSGPGAADQAATDDGGVGQCQPELDHQPTPLGAPAQLAVLVGPGVGLFDHPPAARLNRSRHPPAGDLAPPCPAWSGPAGRAGSRSRRPGARPAGRAAARPYRWRPGSPRAGHRRGGWPGPAAPPAGCQPPRQPSSASAPACAGPLGWARQPGRRRGPWWCTRRWPGVPAPSRTAGHRRPTRAGAAGRRPGGDPFASAAAQGGRRAGVVGDAAVAAAEHQDLDELVEHDPVGDAGAVAAERMVDLTSGEERGDLDP
jgi:hypothetical protein